MKKTTGWIIIILIMTGLVLTVSLSRKKSPNSPAVPVTENNNPINPFASPIDQADKRITKKPFGIFITPQTSPVQPEKFSGFHTGTDFETFPNEAGVDVSFYAICDGKILQKRTATGYVGMLVQSCVINNQPVTVIYGHVKLTSVLKNIGDELLETEKIGFLGQPPTETSNERKHLHLSIHLGTVVNILGYVKNQSDLSNWLDWQKLSE